MAFSLLGFLGLRVKNDVDKTKALDIKVHTTATTNTTTTLRAEQTADRTITLPNINGVIESQANKSQANGYASLGSDSLVPAVQTQPDIQKYANLAAFPGTGNIKLIYLAQDSGITYQWTGSAYATIGGSPSGVVIGPSSATDKAIVRFDGTTGKLIKNSVATLQDSGTFSTTTVNVTSRISLANQSRVDFFEPTTSGVNSVRIKGPDSFPALASYDLKLPNAPGTAGQVLGTTDGTQLSWYTVSGSGPTFVDWTSFTPTSTLGVNPLLTYTGSYRRIGNSLDIRYIIEATGSIAGATDLQFDMPGSFVIDTSKLTNTTSNPLIPFGIGIFNNGGTQAYQIAATFFNDTPDKINILYLDVNFPVLYKQFAANDPVNIGTGSFISIDCFGIPIV